MKKLEISNETLYNVLKKVDTVNNSYHANKDDFVGGLYDISAPRTRVEVWNEATRIDVYVGLDTPIYSTVVSVLTSESDIFTAQTHVKRSKNEIVIKFYSVKAFELFFSNYYKKEEKKEEKTTATKKNNTKKNNKKVNKTA